MMMKNALIAILAVAACSAAVCSTATAQEEDSTKTPRARFWQARRVLLEGDPASAAELFRAIRKEAPEDAIVDDCLFWIGRCYLRLPDREPDAVAVLGELLRDHPESPFLDDAARELDRIGDRSAVEMLTRRLAEGGTGAPMAARALAEFGEEAGIRWLADKEGVGASRLSDRPAASADSKSDLSEELRLLRSEVARLRKEVEESLALVRKLLAEKEARDREAEKDR